jgi:two-component SAPR family response regulator
MLAVHLDVGVHRQLLWNELWPDDDESGASRKLQVAISSIRRVLELSGAKDVIRRRGDVYLIDANQDVACDVQEFTRAVGEARALLARRATVDAIPVLRRARELYSGDLLPEDGAAEWVVTIRQQLQAAACDIAHALGTVLLEQRQSAEAVGVCRWGLANDRFHDPLWRLLLDALDADNDLAGRAKAVDAYDSVLVELGIDRGRPSSGG